jgi:predicted permease
LRDIRYVLRSLWHAKSYSFAAVLTFAVGLGVNMAIFAVVDRILFRPLPFGHPDQLLSVHRVDIRTGQVYLMLPRAVAFQVKRTVGGVKDFGYAGNTRPYFLDGPDDPPLRLTEASFNVLDVLEVVPIAGRGFRLDDALLRRRLILLRQEVWERRYGAASSLLGRPLSDTKGTAEIVGILPAGFVIPSVNWASVSDGLLLSADALSDGAGAASIPGFVIRLFPDANASAVKSQIERVATNIAQGPDSQQRVLVRAQSLQAGMFWNCRAPLRLLFGSGLLVWLISCVNVGTLMATRHMSAEKQILIRRSLGASTSTLVAAILTESALLGVAGSMLALLFMGWSIHVLPWVIPSFINQLTLSGIDSRLVVFVLSGALIGSAVAAATPAYRVTRIRAERLAAGPARSAPSPRRAGLLVGIATCVNTLLVLAGILTAESLLGLVTKDLGFRPVDLYLVSVRVGTPARTLDYAIVRRYVELIQSQSHVLGVTGTDAPPGSGETSSEVTLENGKTAKVRHVLNDYFEVVGTRLIAGRSFTDSEMSTMAPVSVLSERAGKEIWPDLRAEQMMGREVRLRDGSTTTVVGVVQDSRVRHALPLQAEIFTPWTSDAGSPVILARVERGEVLDIGAIRHRIREEFGQAASVTATPVNQFLQSWLDDPKLYAVAFGLFAALGLFLTAIGLAALTFYDVSLRQQEFAVRAAIGASQRQLRSLILRRALEPVLGGVALGCIATIWTGRLVQAMLIDVRPTDLMPYALTVLLLLGTAGVSAWIPARRGSEHLLLALRAE